MAHVNVTEEYQAVFDAAQERGWKAVAQRNGLALLAHPHSFARLSMPLADKDGSPKAVAPDSPEKLAEKIDRTGELSAAIAKERGRPKRGAKKGEGETPAEGPTEPEQAGRAEPEETEEAAPAARREVVSEKHPFTPTELRVRPRNPRPTTAVVERTWSDGSVDYACSAVGCDHAADRMRAVSSHFGAKHGRGGDTPTIRSLMTPAVPVPVVVEEAAAQDAPKRESEKAEQVEQHEPARAAEPVEPRTPEDRLAVIRAMLLPADEVAQENLRLRAEIHALQDEVSRLQSALAVVAEAAAAAAR